MHLLPAVIYHWMAGDVKVLHKCRKRDQCIVSIYMHMITCLDKGQTILIEGKKAHRGKGVWNKWHLRQQALFLEDLLVTSGALSVRFFLSSQPSLFFPLCI